MTSNGENRHDRYRINHMRNGNITHKEISQMNFLLQAIETFNEKWRNCVRRIYAGFAKWGWRWPPLHGGSADTPDGVAGRGEGPAGGGFTATDLPLEQISHERSREGSFNIPTGGPRRHLSQRRTRHLGQAPSAGGGGVLRDGAPAEPIVRDGTHRPAQRGTTVRRRSPQPSNGCTGTTVGTCSNPSGMCLRPNSRRTQHRQLRKPAVAARLAQINPRDSRGISFGTRPGPEAVGKAARNPLQ